MDDAVHARIGALEAKIASLEAALDRQVEPVSGEREPTDPTVLPVSRRRLLWSGGALAAGAAGAVLATPSPAAADPASSVTFSPPAGSGISATNVQDALVELDTEKQPRAWLDVRDFGAKGNGTIDDTTAIQTCITTMSSFFGGGTVLLPPGDYKITGPITVPHGVDLWGCGGIKETGASPSPGTVIQAAATNAQLVFGSPSGGAGSRGGQSGNFVIDGMNTAAPTTGLLYLDLCVERQFTAIMVTRSASDGVVVERSQNCTFTAIQVGPTSENGLVLDKGAGGNAFVRCEFEQSGHSNILIREPNDDPMPPYPYNGVPQHNLFLHCINERAHPSDSAYQAGLLVTGGQRNRFSNCIFSLSTDYKSESGWLVEISSGWAQFDDCHFSGHAAGVQPACNGLHNAGAGVFFTGLNWFTNTPIAVQWDDSANAWGDVVGHFRYSAVTTRWAGDGDWQNKPFVSAFPFASTIEPQAKYGFRSIVRGEGGYRFEVGTNGQVRVGDGTNFSIPVAEWRLPTTVGDTAGGWETPHHVRLKSGALTIDSTSNPPAALLQANRAVVYVRNGLLVIEYKVGTTTHCHTMPLNSPTTTWSYSTTPPP